jgi:hypothetical protein
VAPVKAFDVVDAGAASEGEGGLFGGELVEAGVAQVQAR